MNMTRKEAIGRIQEHIHIHSKKEPFTPYLDKAFDMAIEALKEQRPHGEWIDESTDALKCSACGRWVYKPFIGGFPTERSQHYNPNYCAFCGADMREGEAE